MRAQDHVTGAPSEPDIRGDEDASRSSCPEPYPGWHWAPAGQAGTHDLGYGDSRHEEVMSALPPSGTRPWVAYVSRSRTPGGRPDPAASTASAASIAASGRDVLVLALPGEGAPVRDHDVVVEDPSSGGTVRVLTRPPLPGGSLARQVAHHVMGARDALALVEGASPTPPSHLVVYGTVATPLVQALRWGRSRRVPVLVDVVERYSPIQFTGGFLAPGFLSATAGFDIVAPRADGVIAISRYLERHFTDRGVPTLRVPPTTHLADVPIGNPGAGPFRIGYFGSPGRKDLLGVVVEAVARARVDSGNPTSTSWSADRGRAKPWNVIPGSASSVLELLGRVPQADVSTVLGTLHATVLARPPARYSRAGFPTKVVESLAVGTPVVCNLTGDLEDVVVEGESGWVASGPTVPGDRLGGRPGGPDRLRGPQRDARSGTVVRCRHGSTTGVTWTGSTASSVRRVDRAVSVVAQVAPGPQRHGRPHPQRPLMRAEHQRRRQGEGGCRREEEAVTGTSAIRSEVAHHHHRHDDDGAEHTDCGQVLEPPGVREVLRSAGLEAVALGPHPRSHESAMTDRVLAQELESS